MKIKEAGEAGMTLRDYFAAKALAAVIPFETELSINEKCSQAYSIADAMLEARQKEGVQQ